MKRNTAIVFLGAFILILFFILYLFKHYAPVKVVSEPENKVNTYNALTLERAVSTSEFEGNMERFRIRLNSLSEMAAIVAKQSHQTNMSGDRENFQGIIDVLNNITDNVMVVAEKFTQKDLRLAEETKEIVKKLKKMYTYSFGPERPEGIKIALISNEGKGNITMPDGRVIRYISSSGLIEAKQNHREVIVVEILADGDLKVADGIYYSGQESVTLNWDERTFKDLKGYFVYHNVNTNQRRYLLKK